MRFACDTGGTFTDLIVEDSDGALSMYKAQTTPEDPVLGVLQSLKLASEARDISLSQLLQSGEMFIHGTTHATNAIVTQSTAKTALLTTAGHPDILVLREGGRIEPFNFLIPYPAPYVPRSLTYEIPERIDSVGNIVTPLEDSAVLAVIEQLKRQDIEAIAVCFLWSITNPAHEQRVGQLLSENLPDVPCSLSHALNPTLREYRRASSTAIDASLKPLMTKYMGSLTQRLAEAGFNGRTLVLTSQGGMIDAEELAAQPIHAINSGPSMAPIAGRYYAQKDSREVNAIIADAGGTTYDVSLVHRGRIPKTRETWIGQPFRGHMTGFPSINIKSVGAGGGSIARVDSGGVLHVGPRSAGAVPGPVCYNLGGTEPTLTDAALVLGYLNAEFFLGGTMKLDFESSRAVIKNKVADPLGLGVPEAAAAIVSVITENMVQAISEITVNQGIDPENAILIGGGGAAGLNSIWIARRLGCPSVLIPEIGAGLSAYGAMISELSREYRTMFFTTSENWDIASVNRVLEKLGKRCQAFVDGPGAGAIESSIEFFVEARYAGQVWEIEVPLATTIFKDRDDLFTLVNDFHAVHEEIFAINDPNSIVEMVGWTATVSCRLRKKVGSRLQETTTKTIAESRDVHFEGAEFTTPIYSLQSIPVGMETAGPAIIETPFTTIVIDPHSRFSKSEHGSVIVVP